MTTEPECHEVTQSVHIDAGLDEVWELLTDPAGLGTWLGREVELEVRPGGVGRVIDPDGAHRQVLVTDVEGGASPNRLAWHWWQDGGPLSSVEIVAVPTATGTSVTVVERLEAPVVAGPQLSAGGRAGASSSLQSDAGELTDARMAWGLRLARLRVAAALPRHALVG